MPLTAVAMSGGLDSSVAALLLERQGTPVVGLSMLLWDRSQQVRNGRCCGSLDLGDARRVAEQIGLPHYTLRMDGEFRRHVVDPFVDSYVDGRTPSPCISCNTEIKFEAFWERARRLGAGRIYHCMSSVGQMWRAFDLMLERDMTREVHGGLLEEKQFMHGFIADSYIDIQASRLLTIATAEKMNAEQDARTDISAIKVFVPAAYARVVDRAIQTYGAKGISGDLPLAGMYLGARTLRIADGPDEVHKILIAKNILKRYHGGESWDFGN